MNELYVKAKNYEKKAVFSGIITILIFIVMLSTRTVFALSVKYLVVGLIFAAVVVCFYNVSKSEEYFGKFKKCVKNGRGSDEEEYF